MKANWSTWSVSVVFLGFLTRLGGLDWGTSFLIAGVVVSFLLALRSLRFAWGAFVVSMTMAGQSFGLFGLTILPEHLFLLPLIAHSVRRSRDRGSLSSTLREKRLSLMLALLAITTWFLSVGLFSFYNSPSPMSSLRLLSWLLINIAAIVIVSRLVADTSRLVSDALVASVLVLPIYALGWLIANLTGTRNVFVEADYASNTFRLKGLMLEPNLFAGLALLLICVAFAYRRELAGRLFVCSVGLLSFCLFITYTRAAWIVLFAMLAHTIWTSGLRHRISLVFAMGAIAVLAGSFFSDPGAISTASVADTVRLRFESLLDFESGTGAYRYRIWMIALEEINQDGWLYGHGYNSFAQSHSALDTSDGTLYLSLLWLALIYDGGLLAFALFVAAFFLLWINSRSGAGWFYIAFIVLSTSTNPIWYMFPWVFAALLVRPTSPGLSASSNLNRAGITAPSGYPHSFTPTRDQ